MTVVHKQLASFTSTVAEENESFEDVLHSSGRNLAWTMAGYVEYCHYQKLLQPPASLESIFLILFIRTEQSIIALLAQFETFGLA